MDQILNYYRNTTYLLSLDVELDDSNPNSTEQFSVYLSYGSLYGTYADKYLGQFVAAKTQGRHSIQFSISSTEIYNQILPGTNYVELRFQGTTGGGTPYYIDNVTLVGMPVNATPEISSGYEYTLTTLSNLFLDVSGGGNTPGTALGVYEFNGTAAQEFDISYQGNGEYTITPMCAPSLVVGKSGNNVVLANPGITSDKRWYIIKEASGGYYSYRIINKADVGLYLRASSATHGVPVVLDSGLSFWRLTPVTVQKSVPVKVYIDQSFITTYPNNSTQAVNYLFADAETPFMENWSFDLVQSTPQLATGLPADSCIPGYDAPCTSACIIDPSISEHNTDKCLVAAYSYMKQNYSITSSYELQTLFVSHVTCCGGRGNIDDVYTTVHIKEVVDISQRHTSDIWIGNVRRFQHELSHNLGLDDRHEDGPQCTSGYNCIMNGGFDDVPTSVYLETIWCPDCQTMINAAKFD